jgi:tetratricopeptide (TPR) repeat protein
MVRLRDEMALPLHKRFEIDQAPPASGTMAVAAPTQTTFETLSREVLLADIEDALDRGEYEVASDLASALLAHDDTDAEAIALHAWASIRGGDASEEELLASITALNHAITLDRTSDVALYYRGMVHKKLNNVPAAFRDFARALQINPQHAAADHEVRMFAMRVRLGSTEHRVIRTDESA